MNIYTAEDKEYLFVSTSFKGGHSTSLRLDSLAFWPLGGSGTTCGHNFDILSSYKVYTAKLMPTYRFIRL